MTAERETDHEEIWTRSALHLTDPIRGSRVVKVGITSADGFGGFYVYLSTNRRLHIGADRIVAVEQAKSPNVQYVWARLGNSLLKAVKLAGAGIVLFIALWVGIAAWVGAAFK